uniref:Uncharacterized protein n=1 Tax=Ditylenchus dipsaci TaxID=166011 RepID=A0A915DWX0_9BILA
MSVFNAGDLLTGEFNRRKEFKFGRGFSAKLRTWKGQILPYSFKAARERQERNVATEKLLLHINSNNESIILDQQNWMKDIVSDCVLLISKQAVQQIVKPTDLIALRKRLNMHCFVELQQSVQLLFPTKRSLATSVIHLKNVTELDVVNSLIEFPKWIGYQYHFVRVCSKEPLKLAWSNDSGLLVVEPGDKTRNLRVRPTKYYQKLAKSQKATAKSMSCESGFSTISLISTATTSPNSWCNDWKWQPRHAEYDHRLLRTCAADMEQVQDYLFLNNRFDPVTDALCEQDKDHSAYLPSHNMIQIECVEKRLQS